MQKHPEWEKWCGTNMAVAIGYAIVLAVWVAGLIAGQISWNLFLVFSVSWFVIIVIARWFFWLAIPHRCPECGKIYEPGKCVIREDLDEGRMPVCLKCRNTFNYGAGDHKVLH